MEWFGGTGEGQFPPGGEYQTYRVSLPKHMLRLRCPVEGCMGGASNRTNLRVHFSYRHVRDTIVILEEGNRPYPQCPKCVIFMSHKDLNVRHLATDFCRRGEERKWHCLVEEEAREGT